MTLHNQATCKRCGQGMTVVADIAPVEGRLGLIAFLCPNCGATQSTLTYGHRDRHAQQQQQIQPRKADD